MGSSKVYVFFCLALIVFSFLIRLIGWDDSYFGLHIDRKLSTLQTIEFYAHKGVDFLKAYAYWVAGWQEYPLKSYPFTKLYQLGVQHSPKRSCLLPEASIFVLPC